LEQAKITQQAAAPAPGDARRYPVQVRITFVRLERKPAMSAA
jgi:hypothetical protein